MLHKGETCVCYEGGARAAKLHQIFMHLQSPPSTEVHWYVLAPPSTEVISAC